jgi:TolB-like protein/Tfp pilus assembly protein PilF
MWELAVDPNDVRGASRFPVAVRLLGPFRVVRTGADASPAPSRKVRALIAYLAMAPRPIHRAKLCELLWDIPDDPRGGLRWCLTKIRGLLSDSSHERVKTENDWVSIDTSTIEVDALWVAARAEAAISGGDLDLLEPLAAKFEGEFLEGFEADRVPLFETWLVGERQRFQSLHAEVLSRIITLLPPNDRALPYIRKRLDLLPYDVASHRDLLATLAACDRIAEGKAHLEAATRLFRSQGLNSAALDKAWREHRQLPAREMRPESSPLPIARPAAAAITVGTAAHAAEVKPVPPRLSIVVLPFANISGDASQEYFVDGVTESLTTDLSRISGSFVIGRNTAFTYKGKPVDARTIGRELNVRYVLEGSVQKSGARIRVNVQLIDAESSAHMWAERFDQPLADLFDMQDEIVARLANALNSQLVAAEARRAEQAPNPDSMDLYFQGWAWLNKGLTSDNVAQARSFFDRALTADPDNVEALIGSAVADVIEGANSFVTDSLAAFTAAEAKLIKALSSAPDHPRAHMSLGFVDVRTKRAARGIAEFEHALKLDRNLADAHSGIGFGKIFVGHAEETEAHIGEALRLSPRDTMAYTWMNFAGIANLHLGGWEQAIGWFRRSIEANRNYPHSHFVLGAAHAQLGRLAEARFAVKAGVALDPSFAVSRACADWTAMSDDPTYLAQLQPIFEGLRKAGVPGNR